MAGPSVDYAKNTHAQYELWSPDGRDNIAGVYEKDGSWTVVKCLDTGQEETTVFPMTELKSALEYAADGTGAALPELKPKELPVFRTPEYYNRVLVDGRKAEETINR